MAGCSSVRPEPVRVSAPLDPHNLSCRRVLREDRRAWRHDQVGAIADPAAPPAHGLDEERAVDTSLDGALVIDHRRVDLEHSLGPGRAGRHHAFAAEVVIALHDDRRLEPRDDAPDLARAHPSELLRAERRRHRHPVHRVRGRSGRKRLVARRDEHMDLVPEGREPFGHCGDMNRPARGAGNGLVDGAVENSHGSECSNGSRLRRNV